MYILFKDRSRGFYYVINEILSQIHSKIKKGTASCWQTWCKSLILKRLPITEWIPKYNTDKALADLIAGVTVGLTYGLYSSFVGCFVYVVFGSCKDITLGPTALMALMTYEQVQNRNFDYAFLLRVHIGYFSDYCSVPVER
ncbi:unnamed protein product [Leptidea sinapis]|nr:unnamed protein product [Leptidea sinapis]